jgi:hypothetical protein
VRLEMVDKVRSGGAEGLELDDVDVEFFDVEPEPPSPMQTASSGTLDSGAGSAHAMNLQVRLPTSQSYHKLISYG